MEFSPTEANAVDRVMRMMAAKKAQEAAGEPELTDGVEAAGAETTTWPTPIIPNPNGYIVSARSARALEAWYELTVESE